MLFFKVEQKYHRAIVSKTDDLIGVSANVTEENVNSVTVRACAEYDSFMSLIHISI